MVIRGHTDGLAARPLGNRQMGNNPSAEGNAGVENGDGHGGMTLCRARISGRSTGYGAYHRCERYGACRRRRRMSIASLPPVDLSRYWLSMAAVSGIGSSW